MKLLNQIHSLSGRFFIYMQLWSRTHEHTYVNVHSQAFMPGHTLTNLHSQPYCSQTYAHKYSLINIYSQTYAHKHT